ncbi:hypothetical protein SprV_0501929600 [Sparganum proliferum]
MSLCVGVQLGNYKLPFSEKPPTQDKYYTSTAITPSLTNAAVSVLCFKELKHTAAHQPTKELNDNILNDLFRTNGYPSYFIKQSKRRVNRRRPQEEQPEVWGTIPHIKGVSEAVSRQLQPASMGTAHRPQAIIRRRLMQTKDTLPPTETSAVVYQIRCNDEDCMYVLEAGRKLQTRLHEHKLTTRRLLPNSQLAAHIGETGHSFDFQGATVLGRGTSRTERLPLEAWYSDANSINRHLDLPSAYKVLRHFIRLDEDKTVVRTLGLPSKHGLSTNSPKRGTQTQLTPIEVTTPNRGGHQQSKATASRPRQRKKKKIDRPKSN